MFVDVDPELALAHARYARRRASRIAVVREAAGIAAYHAGEWNEALGELRAARRMGGGPGHLAMMADIERALGRPERALEFTRSPEARELGRADSIELTIVAAGARRDLGELDAAVVALQIPELDPAKPEPWSARLFYAYADNLLAAGRDSEALQWFVHTAEVDDEGATDADRRIAELTGEPLPDDDVEFDVEGVPTGGADQESDPAPDPDPEPSDEAAPDAIEDVTPGLVEATDDGAEADAQRAGTEPDPEPRAVLEPPEPEAPATTDPAAATPAAPTPAVPVPTDDASPPAAVDEQIRTAPAVEEDPDR